MDRKVVILAAFLLFIGLISAAIIFQSSSGEEQDPGIENKSESVQKPEKAQCDQIDISIDSVSGTTAMIRQLNENPVGEVEVTWSYAGGETVSETAKLERRGRTTFVESGSSGAVEEFQVKPLRCDGVVFSR